MSLLLKVPGGFSRMLAAVLEHTLLGPSGLTCVGWPLIIASSQRMLFGRLSNLLSDGDGHRQALDWKGANGIKACFKHVNVLKKDRDQAAMRNYFAVEWLILRLAISCCGLGSLLQGSGLVGIRPGYVEIGCCDHSQLREWTSEKAFRAVDILESAHRRVQEGLLTQGDYGDMETSAGLNRNPWGLLACRPLRPRARQRRDVSFAVYSAASPHPSPPPNFGHRTPAPTLCQEGCRRRSCIQKPPFRRNSSLMPGPTSTLIA